MRPRTLEHRPKPPRPNTNIQSLTLKSRRAPSRPTWVMRPTSKHQPKLRRPTQSIRSPTFGNRPALCRSNRDKRAPKRDPEQPVSRPRCAVICVVNLTPSCVLRISIFNLTRLKHKLGSFRHENEHIEWVDKWYKATVYSRLIYLRWNARAQVAAPFVDGVVAAGQRRRVGARRGDGQ